MVVRILFPVIIAVAWLLLLQSTMITDVWDETHFLVYFYTQSNTIWDKLAIIWTQPIGHLYRPIPISIASIILEQVSLSPFAWQLLRAINIILLLGTLASFLYVFWRWQVKAYLFPIFTILFLFSGSSFISSAWFVNLFDVMSLFLFSCALVLISHELFLIAGIVIGVSFFCKEISLLFAIFLIIMLINKKIHIRSFIQVIIPILILGISYWVLRFNIADYSSQNDIYNFSWETYGTSLFGFLESFWWQNMQRIQDMYWFGIICLILSIFAFKTDTNRLLFTGFILFSSLIYWQMFIFYQHDVIHYLHFIGRLYLIPTALFLLALVLWARSIIFVLIAIPILLGGWQTYHAHQRFQYVFHQIEQLSQKQTSVFIHFPDHKGQINDPFKKIYIGNYPQAQYKIDIKQGLLIEQ